MFTNKIYECLKQYLDRYLFGFDKNQLNMSIIKGNINLKHVNIRPDEANRLIDGLMLPVSLKAGMIGNLQLKFSILSIWNNPLEVTIDDLFMILGPNLSFVSHDESYINDEELDDSYDSTNVYNIFEHELQIKKKVKNVDKLGAGNKDKNNEDNDENSLKNNFRSFLKNLRLTINRLHIRFEDDYFSQQTPFSLGMLMDKLELTTADSEWQFDQPLQLSFFRNPPQHRDQDSSGAGSIILKEFNISNARMYLNSMSEMFIPTSLWDQTRHLENQIFDAMPVEALNDLMIQAFQNKASQMYLISEFSVFASIYNYKQGPLNQKQQQNSKGQQQFNMLKLKMLFTDFDFNITPQMIDDISRLYEFFQNFSISLDLKQYRPQRRPFLVNQSEVNEDTLADHVKRKRKLIVRDWFFYVVWYIRLKKLLLNFYSEQLIESELEQNKEKYEGMMKAAENGKEHFKKYMNEQEKKNKQSDGGKQPQPGQEEPEKKWDEQHNLFKFQGITVKVYEDFEKYKTKDRYCVPSFEMKLDTLVIDNMKEYAQKTMSKKLLLKDIKFFHTQLQKKSLMVNLNHLQSNTLEHIKPMLTDRDQFSKNGGPPLRNAVRQHHMNPSIGSGGGNSIHSQSNSNFPGSNRETILSGGGARVMDRAAMSSSIQSNSKTFKSSEQYDYNEGSYLPPQKSNMNPQGLRQDHQMRSGMHSGGGGNYSRENLASGSSNNINSTAVTTVSTTGTASSGSGSGGQSFLDLFGIKKSTFNNFLGVFGVSTQPASQSQAGSNAAVQPQPTVVNQFEKRENIQIKINDVPMGQNSRGMSGGGDINRDYNPRGGYANDPMNTKTPTKYRQYPQQQQQPSTMQRYGSNHGTANLNRRNQISALLDDEINAMMTAGTSTVAMKSPNSASSSAQALQRSDFKQTSHVSHHNRIALSSMSSKWDKQFKEPFSTGQCMILTKQIAHLYNSSSNQPCFQYIAKQGISQSKHDDKKIDFSIKISSLDIEYCNDIMKNLCDTLVQYKKLHAFRYIPLKNLFQRRENIHRKIELHAPLYLIKKMFITGGAGGRPSSLSQSNLLNEEVKGLGSKPSNGQENKLCIDRQTFSCESSEEDENISDEDGGDSRKNIQQAVSQKSLQLGASFKKRQAYEVDIQQQNTAIANLGIGSSSSAVDKSDQLMFKKIVEYERMFAAHEVQVFFDFTSLDIIVLQSQQSDSQIRSPISRMKLKPNTVQFYKSQEESGFEGFGIQFQTINKFEMYFMFFKQMKRAVEVYTKNPVFVQSSENYFDQLREILRTNFKQKGHQDRDTIKNILGMNQSNKSGGKKQQSFQQIIKGEKGSPVFNAKGVQQQQELFSKGKTTTAGMKNSNHYNLLFNNIDDTGSNQSQNQTPKLSYKDLALMDSSKQDVKNLKAVDPNDPTYQKLVEGTGDCEMHLDVQCSEEDEDEEQKQGYVSNQPVPKNHINTLGNNGSMIKSSASGKHKPEPSSSSKDIIPIAQSSTSFLAQMKNKQQFQNQDQQALSKTTQLPKGKPQSSTRLDNTQQVEKSGFSGVSGNVEQMKQMAKQVADVNKNGFSRGRSQQQDGSVKNINSSKNPKGVLISGSNFGSSCEEDLLIQEHNEDDAKGMSSTLQKQMNPSALKKTKSTSNDASATPVSGHFPQLSSGMIKRKSKDMTKLK